MISLYSEIFCCFCLALIHVQSAKSAQTDFLKGLLLIVSKKAIICIQELLLQILIADWQQKLSKVCWQNLTAKSEQSLLICLMSNCWQKLWQQGLPAKHEFNINGDGFDVKF